MGRGKQDDFPAQAPGWRSTSLDNSYLGKWAWGGHCMLVAGGTIAVAVLYPEVHVAVLWSS